MYVQYIVSPHFKGLIQTGPCPESEKVRILKTEYNTVRYCTINNLYCHAHILMGYDMVQYAYTVYMRVKYGYTSLCSTFRVAFDALGRLVTFGSVGGMMGK